MDNSLAHFGIKGMKWGVRRYQNRDGSLTPAGKKRYADDDSSSVKNMSDQELREKINRLNLEKQYKDLISSPKQVNRGKKILTDILESSSKNIGTQLATYFLGEAVNKYIGKGKTIVNPKKGQKDK